MKEFYCNLSILFHALIRRNSIYNNLGDSSKMPANFETGRVNIENATFSQVGLIYTVCAARVSDCGPSPEIRGLSPIPLPTLALYEQEHSRREMRRGEGGRRGSREGKGEKREKGKGRRGRGGGKGRGEQGQERRRGRGAGREEGAWREGEGGNRRGGEGRGGGKRRGRRRGTGGVEYTAVWAPLCRVGAQAPEGEQSTPLT